MPDQADAGRVRALLESQRGEAAARLAALRGDFDGVVMASADSNADDEHDPEGATIAVERSQLGALIVQAQQQLTDIDDARTKLDEARYGVCETCGRPIARARMDARPTARDCIDCASAAPRRA